MQIYIDESGDLGKKGKRFFVIAALIPDKPKRIKNIIKRCCVKFGRPNGALDEIKGADLTFPRKQEMLYKFNQKDDFHCAYIVGDKNHIFPKLFDDNNICFNYLASFLFKAILKGASEDVNVLLDNRTLKVASKNSLEDYIRLEAITKWGFEHNITFSYGDSKVVKNLQAIHLIANLVYGRYTYNKMHLYNMINNKFTYRIKFPQNKFDR